MIAATDRVFISYARVDLEHARLLAAELRSLKVNIWFDVDDLKTGVDWRVEIQDAIQRSRGMVVLVSPESAARGALAEISVAETRGVPLFPVFLGTRNFIPSHLQHLAGFVVQPYDQRSIAAAAAAIAVWVKRGGHETAIDTAFAEQVSSVRADVAKQAGADVSELGKHSVFVVHGHDEKSLRLLCEFLDSKHVRSVVLKDIEEQEISLLKRFLTVAEQAAFAVVLLTPDDLGCSIPQFNSARGGQNALRFRGRQNVILELGFFIGKLGFERVFVLQSEPPEPWPTFELPSDLEGAVYKRLDAQGNWKRLLERALRDAGVIVE